MPDPPDRECATELAPGPPASRGNEKSAERRLPSMPPARSARTTRNARRCLDNRPPVCRTKLRDQSKAGTQQNKNSHCPAILPPAPKRNGTDRRTARSRCAPRQRDRSAWFGDTEEGKRSP